MALTKVTYSMFDSGTVSVADYGAVGDNITDDTAAIQSAINASSKVYFPPTNGNYYKITSPLIIPDGSTLYMDGVRIRSTGAGILRFSPNAVTIYASNCVLLLDTATPSTAISLVSGASAVCGVEIYGFPIIQNQQAPIVNIASRGIDMTGFYRSYLEVNIVDFYLGIYADGNILTTYYNVIMKPDIKVGEQGYGINLKNLSSNACSIVSPFINAQSIGYGGILFESTGSCTVVGGYLEGFADNASSFGIEVDNSTGITVLGAVLEGVSTTTTNYALRISTTSASNSFINLIFAGGWASSSKLCLNNSSLSNTFLGNNYTDVISVGIGGNNLQTRGAFFNQITSQTTSSDISAPSVIVQRNAEGKAITFEASSSSYSGIYFGNGSPEGIFTAIPGSIYLRKDGGSGTCFYVKESGSGNTGWVAK